MSAAEVWAGAGSLLAGGVIGVVVDRFYETQFGRRHKLSITLEYEGRDDGGTNTTITVKNKGDYFERDTKITVEASVSPNDQVRFLYTTSPNIDQMKIVRKDTSLETLGFNHFLLSLNADGMQKDDEVVIAAVSTHFISTLKVDAMTDNAVVRYNSLKDK